LVKHNKEATSLSTTNANGRCCTTISRQDIATLGSAGAIQQAQTQATLDAQREANRLAAYEPYERLGYMGAGIGNVLGGMQGQYQTTVTPNQSALQQAMGILGTGIGAYKTLRIHNE
jgi:hypothetical protein